MIVKMLKYSFLVYHKEYDGFLEKLRSLGVLHVIEKRKEVSEGIQAKYDLVKAINFTIKYLDTKLTDKPLALTTMVGSEVFARSNDLHKQIDQLQQKLLSVRKELATVLPWGEFSPEMLSKLRDQGVRVKFYTVSTSRFKTEWLEQYPIQVIADVNGVTYFVILGTELQDAVAIDAEENRTPERPANLLTKEVEGLEKDLDALNAEVANLALEGLEALKAYRNEVLQDTEFHRVMENTQTEADDKLRLLEGWIPVGKKNEVEAALEGEGIVFIEQEPTEQDKIPILLKNNKFSQKFEILGELYSLPSYKELDLTPFFAPFYMIFFGFCLGDAGYGILMCIAALVAKRKVAKGMRAVLSLVFYLGLSTIFFGIIGGTFFGIPLYETSLPVYSSLAAEFEARGTGINMILFYLSLLLGGTQIIFGLILKAVNETIQFGWKFALGTYGWATLLIGAVAIAIVHKFIGVPMEALNLPLYGLLAVSGLLILPLNNLYRNPLLNVGVGLWNSYNMVTGLLGDLLSYIRLFALGISSAILGFVFNSLAVSMSGDIPVVSVIIMVIILAIGHGINLFMSGLGSFVHPMRLTFVEFYKNSGFAGGGRKYYPFRKLT